jgi:hypothetical protein
MIPANARSDRLKAVRRYPAAIAAAAEGSEAPPGEGQKGESRQWLTGMTGWLALAVPLSLLSGYVFAQDGGGAMRPLVHQPEVQPEPLSGLLERPTRPAEILAGAEAERWRRGFVGKPVHDISGRWLGEVVDVVENLDGMATAVLVTLVVGSEGASRTIAVPATQLRTQLGGDHVVLPAHYEAMLAELTPNPAGLAGWRASWLDGASARLQDGGQIGTVDGFVFTATGQVAEVMVRTDDGRSYAVPRSRLRVEGDDMVVAVPQDELATLEVGTYPPLAAGALAELPGR